MKLFKRWILVFILFMLGTGLLLGGINVIIDPYGVFGDRVLNWYSYDMTKNPRVAKIAYLNKNHSLYDSYIVGCSKTSSFSTEKLDKYFNARFYNMLMYGGDMYDIEKTVDYIVSHYEAKNIIVNIGLEESVKYKGNKKPMVSDLHALVDGSSLTGFYGRYFLANPEYSFFKLNEYIQKTYLPKKYNVFEPETGVYNKIVRDREAIGNLKEYIGNNPDFNVALGKNNLDSMDKAVAAIKRIKELCESKGINFMLFTSPVYYREVQIYNEDQLMEYWKKIAEVTDFWDFSGYNSIGYEPRYFYDIFHFRNAIGDMALAYVFNDKSVYLPPDFGYHTTRENVSGHAQKIFARNSNKPQPVETYATDVPILMYHDLNPDKSKISSVTITPDKFKEDMKALKENGYHTIFFSDLLDYVQYGKELPSKPILVTFDDGYESVYNYAYPILKELGMKATVSVIGISVGKDTYKDTDIKILPHFDYNKAREMYESGIIDIQSHSYDMHDNKELQKDYRDGVLQKKGESESRYIALFKQDYLKSREDIENKIGNKEFVYFYPFGKNSVLSEVLLREMGNRITVTVQPGVNTIIKGLPQSLYSLKRINVGQDLTGYDIINKIGSYIDK